MKDRYESVRKTALRSIDYRSWGCQISDGIVGRLLGDVDLPVDTSFDGLRARLCFIAQAGSKVCWTPSLKRVSTSSRPALEVLEIYWDLSEDRARRVLAREFGMDFGGFDE